MSRQPQKSKSFLRAGLARAGRGLLGGMILMSAACGASGAAGSGAASSAASGRAAVEALPFVLCSAYGTAGTPCFPTNADRAGRAAAACRDAHRGRCENHAGKGVCLLAPVADGTACGDGATGRCLDGRCVPAS